MDGVIFEARRLGDSGKYDEATSKLRQTLEVTTGTGRLSVVAELAVILRNQGYWKSSFEELEREIAKSAADFKEHPTHLQLEMDALLLRPIVLSSFKGVLAEGARVYERLSKMCDSGIIDELDPVCIQINISHTNLRMMASQFHDPSQGLNLETALSWVQAAFSKLIATNREREAFQIASHYLNILKSPPASQSKTPNLASWMQMMEDIISLPKSTPLLKAKAMSLMVETVGDIDRERLDDLSSKAIQIFNEEGHLHGAMDVKVQRIRARIKNDYQYLTEALADELNGYFESYQKSNAVAPYQRAIEAILSNIHPWQAFEFRISLNNMRDELAKVAGAKFDSYMNQIRLLATWLTHSGRSARVIEGAEALDSLLGEEDCRWMKGDIGNILAQAYAQLEDFDKSLAWATRAATVWGDSFPSERAEATRSMLQARLRTFDRMRSAKMEETIAFAEAEIEVDLSNGLQRSALQKMEMIVGQVFTPRQDLRREEWLNRMEDTARAIPQTNSEAGDIQTAAICQNRALSLLNAGQNETGTAYEEGCMPHFEEAVTLYMKHHHLVEAASTRQMQALTLYAMFKKTSEPATLQRCIEMIAIAKDAFKAAENTKFVATSTRWHSFYVYISWTRGWATSQAALEALREAEEAWADERTDMTVFATLEAVSRRQQHTSSTELRETYKRAFHICLQESRATALWNWVQRAKARSLSDQLGMGMLIPATLREEVMGHPTMKQLITKEEELTQRINASEPAIRLNLRGELHTIHRLMAQQPPLKAILDLTGGTPATLNQIMELGSQIKGYITPSSVVFVDWFEFGDTIWIIALREGELPQLRKCDIVSSKVASWKREWLDAEPGTTPAFETDDYEEDEEDFPLRALDSLIAPLQQLTSEGDLLIFSPTGVLHSIPIHALFITTHTPIILRNPIIYTASLTTFWQCCRRAAAAAPPYSLSWTLSAVFEPSPAHPVFQPTERAAVYSTITRLAVTHRPAAPTTILCGCDATLPSVCAALEDSALFHFHGHCALDRRAVADQSLEVADGAALTARHVFGLRLRASPHVTLVACESASQGVTTGDEPLGLVTALLCAGAGSVAGTLWPTASGTGRQFAERFYGALDRQGGGGGVANLAIVLREAVLALRRRRLTRQPYHWAAFVLHGSWSMRFVGGGTGPSTASGWPARPDNGTPDTSSLPSLPSSTVGHH